MVYTSTGTCALIRFESPQTLVYSYNLKQYHRQIHTLGEIVRTFREILVFFPKFSIFFLQNGRIFGKIQHFDVIFPSAVLPTLAWQLIN